MGSSIRSRRRCTPSTTYHVLRDLGELKGGVLLDCGVTDPRAAVGLGVRRGDATTLLVANLRPASETIRIEGLEPQTRIRRLNQETAAWAGASAEEFRRRWEPLADTRTLELLPYEIVRIDGY